MCLAESGLLIEIHGEGVTRTGIVETEQGTMTVSLTYLPDALPGDAILFHSGIGFRIVERNATVTGASRSGSSAD